MADTKISALTASTTPLAGSEVLPIVQSGVTKKVSVANLTAGRSTSVSELISDDGTQGRWTITQDSGGNKLFSTTPSFGGWRTGSVQANGTGANMVWGSDGNTTVGVGNLVIGTSGKGIDFSATPGTGTSELLNDYETGTWTPTYAPTTGSFTTLTTSVLGATYVKIGRQVICKCLLRTTDVVVGTAAGALKISGLPFTAAVNDFGGVIEIGVSLGFLINNPDGGYVDGNTVLLHYRTTANGESQASTVSHLTTGASANKNYIIATITYEAT